MSLVLINSISDTFTPTHSGAIGTWHWEICRSAARQRIEPLVISKSMGNDPYDWPNKVMIPYPKGVQLKGVGRLYKLQQKLGGWGHIHQEKYNELVASAILEKGVQAGPMVLHNDPELSVFLRERFPDAVIVSHFYNQNACSEKFRTKFGEAGAPTLSTAVSDFTARWIEQYYHLTANSVKTLYNGVDCERFTPAASSPQGKIVINFVGRLSRDKGPDLLLNAARNIAATNSNFSLQLLGSTFWGGGPSDPYTAELEQLATELKQMGVDVRMPGFIDRWALPGELQKAHIHVVPSRWDEPFALSTLEGMACGLATVACSTGGTPEAVNGAGLMFAKDDVETLTAHLQMLIENNEERARYVKLARDRALDFTWDKIWLRVRELTGV